MSEELMVVNTAPVNALRTADQIKADAHLIQEVMKSVMKDKTHYGKIPGCGDKPALLKPGAEKIMSTFRISPDPIVEDLSGPDVIRYRVKVRMMSASGIFLGAGLGECSSNETKYKWRKAYKNEYDDMPEDRRRVKHKSNRNGENYDEYQIRVEIADVANTVLKMAKKRALVDGVLTVTAASDIFAQDIEDLEPEVRNNLYEVNENSEPTTVEMPKATTQQPPKSTGKAAPVPEPAKKMLRKKIEEKSINETELCAKYGIKDIDSVTIPVLNEMLTWISKQ